MNESPRTEYREGFEGWMPTENRSLSERLISKWWVIPVIVIVGMLTIKLI